MERRRSPRFDLKVNAKYKVVSPDEVFKAGRTDNISAEGLCFESDEKLQQGAYVNLEVDLEDSISPVALVGEVRWSILANNGGRYTNGVKLVDIVKSDEGRFLKYYCDRMIDKLSEYLKR